MVKARVSSSAPFFGEESIREILRDIESTLKGGILTDGTHVHGFEREFAEYVGVKHAVAVNSGTSALEIALRHFRLSGREVVVPTNTFVATPNSVLFAGGKPVFADIREDTLCVDVDDVRRRLSPRTAGVIVVHIAGLVCPQTDELRMLCVDNGLFLLEDAAHAHGAAISGKKAGALGDAGCFSFFPTKVVTTGEGGMITTDDAGLADDARCMRSHGLNSEREMVMLGHNWRMSEVAAIIGRHQLKRLEEFVLRRNDVARLYEAELAKVKGLSLFRTPAGIRHSYYKYPVRLDDDVDREKIAERLKNEFGVETGTVYDPPCHLHRFYRENFGAREGDLPVSENVLKKVLCLPMHVGMSRETVEYVSDSLESVIG